MSSPNLKNIASIVKESLPFHIREGDYDNFVRFIELYYEWLSEDGNPLDVMSEITDYGDLDKTLDIFVNQFKSEIGAVFPSVTRIRDKNTSTKLLSALFNATAQSNSENETFVQDTFMGNGIVSEFLMSFKDPSYYIGRDISPYVADLKVYTNPANPFSGVPVADASLLSFPDDYTELTEGTDYFLSDDKLFFGQENNILAPLNGVSIVVVFRLRTNPTSSPDKNIEEEQKKRFTDQNHFLKLLKDFYESKGSQKSLKFLFRAFLNEDIDVYYPKENIFKASNNRWVENKSIRTNPNTTSAAGTPVRIIGETSSAIGIIESNVTFSRSNFNVNEYFLGDISGEFQDQENVFVEMDDGRLVKEQLYSCVTGFNIVNPGSNYPRNFNLDFSLGTNGSGSGFSAKIDNTTTGEVSNIAINNAGDNYITGEFVEFVNDGTFGSGAIGRISQVGGVERDFDITWTQDTKSASYPQLVWDISDDPAAVFDSQTSREIEVYLVNRDTSYDDVVLLYDFDTVKSSSVFYEYKNDTDSIRHNAYRENPSFGSAVGNFSLSLKGDGYVRIPDAASYFHDIPSFTIDFWYYGTGGTDSVVFAFNGIGQNDNADLFVMRHLASGQFEMIASDGSNVRRDYTSPTNVQLTQLDTWRHVTIYSSAADGTTVYLDGTEAVDFPDLIVDMKEDAVLTIGADNDDADSGSDMSTAFFGSFRITKGQRFTEYQNQTSGLIQIFGWELDPIQVARRLSDYQFSISSINNTISFMDYDSNGDLVPTAIPDWQSLQLKFKNIGKGPIQKIDIVTGGSGYARNPYAYISDESNGYISGGSGASVSVTGSDIGGIEGISIRQQTSDPSQDGFGVGYTTAPALDLTAIGDGTAQVDVVTGPLCVREGAFVDDQSFASSDNRIHDGYLWQDYSYVVRVNRVIDEWRELIKRVIHPAGMMVFGEVTLTTKIEGKRLKQAILYLFYEIIKNVDVTMKNMDGLGKWTGGTTLDGSGNVINKQTPINSQDLMSSGLILEYNNRQNSLSSLSGVSDDTPVGATVDKGEGRYALLETPSIITPSADSQEIFDSWNRFSHDASGVFPANSSEMNAFVYDNSTNSIVCTVNSSTYIGFYSPQKYTTYNLSLTLSSNNADDDLLSVVLAAETDSQGNEHTISLTRSRGGVGARDYAIIYNLLQSNEQTLFDGNALAPDPTAGGSSDNDGWTGSSGQVYTRVNIIRSGNTFTGSVSQYSTTIPTDSDLDPTTAFSFNLEDHPFLSLFAVEDSIGHPYGIGCWSQNSSTWSDISFTTDSNNLIPSTYGAIDKIAINHHDRFSKSHKHYYESGIIGNFFTLYNVSEQIITGDENRVTRSFAKFEVTSAASTADYILLGVNLLTSHGSLENDTGAPGNVVEFRWDKVSRGNVNRINTNWVGSIRDGADPRDEKFIVNIITRQQEIPSLGTSYRSLERFKFFFDTTFSFDDLIRYRFSPQEEALDSPYLAYYGYTGAFRNTSMAGNQVTLVRKEDGTNVWGVVPVFSQNNFVGITDGTDHDWPNTSIKEVEDLFERNYHAVLDSRVILKPKYLVITDENPETDGLRVAGMTNLSIERSKFRETPQILDNNFETVKLTDIDSKYLEKTNFAHESILSVYDTGNVPTTLEELESLTQIID